MEIKELLKTTPENLAKTQHDALHGFVINKLKEFTKLIHDGKYETAEAMLAFSGAGDGHGDDNFYLDFSETGIEDIGGVISKLKYLKQVSEGKK